MSARAQLAGPGQLAGRVALVTGGAGGIGLGMATAFARAGMHLVLVDLDEAALAEAAESLRATGTTVMTARLDVRDRAGWAALVERVDAELGGVWLLCNNAGVSAFDKLAEMSGDAWDWVIDINLTAVFNGVHAVAPGMIARGQGGHIVNTASAGAFAMAPGIHIGAYYVTKAGVLAMSDQLRSELAEHGIGVSALCPGLVESRLRVTSAVTRPGAPDTNANNDHRVGQPGVISAAEAGERVLEGVIGDHALIITHPEARQLVEGRYATLLAEFDRADASDPHLALPS